MSTIAAHTSRERAATRKTVVGASARGRSQRLTALEVATLVLIALLLVIGVFSARPHAVVPESTRAVQVQTGDTLWSIAQAHPVTGLTTAQTAEKIAHDNHLGKGPLVVGRLLVVPVDGNTPQVASR